MRKLISSLKTSRAARRGSVLILCVVLIVILALVGTAMLSTTRIDRYTSSQNAYNTQVDMLIEGAKNIARGVIVGDLFDTSSNPQRYRPAPEQSEPAGAGTSASGNYDHWDAPLIQPTGTATVPLQNDQWLASLLPSIVTTTPAGAPALRASPVYWDAISGPLIGSDFESPSATGTFASQNRLAPTTISIGGTAYPALREISDAGALGTARLAADADGDGIADAYFCRLLPGELSGVTYYVAYRIVDNAAKVNVNTAWSRGSDFGFSPSGFLQHRTSLFGTGAMNNTEYAGNLGTFPSHVGLMEMLNPYIPGSFPDISDNPNLVVETEALNRYRFGIDLSSQALPFMAANAVIDELTSTQRATEQYVTQGDAFAHSLATRFGNPGINANSTTTDRRYRAFGISDSMALAYRFTLVNRQASPSLLEDTFYQAHLLDDGNYNAVDAQFPDSLYRSAANFSTHPYSRLQSEEYYEPDQAAYWFDENFNFAHAYDTGAVTPALNQGVVQLDNPAVASGRAPEYRPYPRPVRALLTAHNPVSQLIAAHDIGAAGEIGVPPNARVQFDNQNNVPFQMPDYSPAGVGGTVARPVAKTNINTAKFGELWRAFWNVMVDQTARDATFFSGTPFEVPRLNYEARIYQGNNFDQFTEASIVGPTEEHPAQMFRSVLRDPRLTSGVYFTPQQQLLLRAAIAAVNAQDLRDPDQNVTRQDIPMAASIDGVTVGMTVTVFGTERQPFITEVYVNTDTKDLGTSGVNLNGYVGIELHNPYPTEIDISGWALAVLDRRGDEPPTGLPPNTYPGPMPSGRRGLSYFYIHAGAPSSADGAAAVTAPWVFPAGTVIPPGGYLVLENDTFQSRPYGNVIPNATVPVPNLHWVVQSATGEVPAGMKEGRGGELVILRPVDPNQPPLIEENNAAPVDSFDFTGLYSVLRGVEIEVAGGDPAPIERATAWRYRRSNANPAGGSNWQFVYPGRYNGQNQSDRHQGNVTTDWDNGTPFGDPTLNEVNLGYADTSSTYPGSIHTIQLANLGFGGPNPVGTVTPNRYPFGGFMRDGDILQVPYIGAYRVAFADDDTSVLELNAVTIDSAFASDSDVANDEQATDASTPVVESREQVGRFVPLRDSDYTVNPPVHRYNDLAPDGDFDANSTVTTNKWRYRWALDLFDYLTVRSPGNDYTPDVPTPTPPLVYAPQRQPVDNDGDGIVGNVDDLMVVPGAEDLIPLQGLININTAPWKTLAAVPMVKVGDNHTLTANLVTDTWTWTLGTPDGVDDNEQLARGIVLWRDGAPAASGTPALPANGPFKTIWDLYRVPAFRSLQEAMLGPAVPEPGDADGDFSPFDGAVPAPPTPTDTVRNDFEEQNLLLTRVSNLLTTRSDSYIVYLVVQGWTGAGDPNTAQLVVQRRAAFILDRSPVTNTNLNPATYNAPND